MSEELILYKKAIYEMLADCSGWDTEHKALEEAFNRGVDYAKKLNREKDLE